MSVRQPGWWTAARELVGGLSRPRAEIAASDRAIEALVTRSALVSALRSGADLPAHAWPGSLLASLVAPHLVRWRALDRAMRLRASASVVAIAALVALAGHAVNPGAIGPLGWLLPTVAMLAAVGVASAAAAIVRARRRNAS